MRAVVQRVGRASVDVGGERIAGIGKGLLVLLGVAGGDTEKDAEFLAEKISGLRIFEDEAGKMNLSVKDVDGEILVVSQFTLLGDCKKGKRPSFIGAAPPQEAEKLYLYFSKCVENRGVPVKTGRFRAMMDVALVNEGPVTLIIESH